MSALQPPPQEGNLRVLQIINGEFFAGAERVQMHLGRCLPINCVGCDFVALKPKRFVEEFSLPESELILVPMTSRLDLGAARRICRHLPARTYHLLHAHTPRGALVTSRLSRLTGIPWVYHLHSPAARDTENRMRNIANSWVERIATRSSSHFIAVSHSLRDAAIEAGIDPKHVTWVPNGVPAQALHRAAAPQCDEVWTLGMVALFRPRKGIEIALHSLQRLVVAGYNLRLRCIGPFETPEYEVAVRNLVAELKLENRVEFVGFTREVPAALAQLHAMVLPSLYGEGLPMVVLEAMSVGLPVIATRVEGTPEAIHHGEQGILAEPNSVDSLTEAIAALVRGDHCWETLAERGRQRHAEQFSDLAMAAKTADVYRRVLTRSTAAVL